MRHSLKAATALLPLMLALSACGKSEQAATSSTGSADSAPAAVTEAPAALPPASVDDEVVVYDPINTSKLSNTWWEQYNKGG
ncbi:MAG: hypothetical protein FJ164_03335 [Gammaproteobacteria bacterium]|nr:hypothetical protein [Gammaproteobacteria bacterium]